MSNDGDTKPSSVDVKHEETIETESTEQQRDDVQQQQPGASVAKEESIGKSEAVTAEGGIDCIDGGDGGGLFTCMMCGLCERYQYYGRRPPFARDIAFQEDCFLSADPFAPRGEGLFLFFGANCSVCDKAVCQSADCSLFYAKRFCRPCAVDNVHHFPVEIRRKIEKMKR